jgi:ATP/maltotriose-dependent transcriptional regulator MalT
LLSEPERRLLARLSVFAGGWDLEAAERVCSGGEVAKRSVLDLLTELIDKSWIVGETRADARRYRFLETVREYSRERLQAGSAEGTVLESGPGSEEAVVHARHAEYFLNLAEAAEREFSGAAQAGWLDRLDSERENQRAALAWYQTAEDQAEAGLRLAGALGWFWEVHGSLSDGRFYLAEALARSGANEEIHPPFGGRDALPQGAARAKALFWAGVLAHGQTDYAAAGARFEESLTIYRQRGDKANIASALYRLGNLTEEQGDYLQGLRYHEESLAIRRELGDQAGVALSLNCLGNLAQVQGDYVSAKARYEESLAISQELGDRRGQYLSRHYLGVVAEHQGNLELARSIYEECLPVWQELRFQVQLAWTLHGIGYVAYRQGDFPAAHSRLAESLTLFREMEYSGGLLLTIERLGGLALARGQFQRAGRLFAVAASQRAATGARTALAPPQEYDRDVAAVRAGLTGEAFEAAWAEGQAMTVRRAIDYALQEDEPPESATRAERGRDDGADVSRALPLLATKLARPRLPPSLVPRPRLIDRFDRTTPAHRVLAEGKGAARHPARIALLNASPGSGKSSLVSQWCHQQPEGSVAWLSLDREDNDPSRFLRNLGAGLETLAPAAVASAQALLQTAERPPLEHALTLLLNGVAALEQPVTLVLDDYHEIEAAPVHGLVAILVEHLPPTLFLILTTRSDPPLPLARLRLRGQLIEIRDADLRFTHEEVTLFLNEEMGLALPPELVKRLAERTEGWIAGLHMAALSLQGEADSRGFIEAFAGTHRYLGDYLYEEVVLRQPAVVQAFLAKTAFLDRLCGPLCDAVTETPGGQALLQRLATANLFLIPLDPEQRWYRYHHLFADVLRARLLPSDAGVIAALHGRAAAWYEQQSMLREALEHALAAEQIEDAARLIERHGASEPVIARLEELLETWVEQGSEARALDARLLLAKLHWQAGRREQAISVLQPALALAEREEHPPAARVPASFVAAGPALIPVLRQAAAQGVAPETVGQLLAALGGTPTLIEPLSDRELEVLRLLAAGLANAEIAERLFLAVGTVKRHIFNICGKLGANSRTSAVARAHELGML